MMVEIAGGRILKSQRDMDGGKVYYFMGEDDGREIVAYGVVQRLLDKKLITTNQKFPAATFLLTTKGQDRVRRWRRSLRGVGAVVHFDS